MSSALGGSFLESGCISSDYVQLLDYLGKGKAPIAKLLYSLRLFFEISSRFALLWVERLKIDINGCAPRIRLCFSIAAADTTSSKQTVDGIVFGGNASKDLLLARTQAAWEFWLTLLIGVKRKWKNTLMLLSQLELQTALHDHHHCMSDTKHDLDLAWHLGARSVFKWLDPVGLVSCKACNAFVVRLSGVPPCCQSDLIDF